MRNNKGKVLTFFKLYPDQYTKKYSYNRFVYLLLNKILAIKLNLDLTKLNLIIS